VYARREFGSTTSKMIKALPTTPTVASNRNKGVGVILIRSPGPYLW
jgi:hypothetical protein